MYNSNLELIQKFGQVNNRALPFFLSSKSELFFVNDQYFIINEASHDNDDDKQKITVIHRSTGLVYSSFMIYQFFDQMQLYLDKYLLTFNQDKCLLKSYSLNGEFLSEIALDKKLDVTIFYPLDKELCFATDQDNFCIF
jgi:hypothetical protein